MSGKKTYPICFDGLFRQNIVLTSGLVTAPIIVAATTAERAAVLSLSFFMISYLTILICRVIPRRLVYTVRIILYALVASVVFIPTALLLELLFPETAMSVMLYIEIIVVNSLVLAKTESRFYLIPFSSMAIDSLVYIAGYAIVAFAVGIIRELLTYGTLFGFYVGSAIMPAAKSPFFGFFLVGLFAAACRAYYNRRRERETAEPELIRKEAEE
ncbi:MAG: NADH:ubiquinone oxidoreductase subunit RnfE [Oscillospiraceae bacterium]|nr:NADH:ubiquinone oxidoreductase subunit RnfE [Oscillospiraceae bacterium]